MDWIGNINTTTFENECWSQLVQVMKGVTERKLWALKLFDSWGRFPSGVLFDHRQSFGNYLECIDVISDSNENHTAIRGRYCMLSYNLELPEILPENITKLSTPWFSTGICIPNACQASDIKSIFSENFNESIINLDVPDEFCRNSEPDQFNSLQWFAVGIFTLLLILLLLGTIYDICLSYRKKKGNPILLSFSVLKNSKRLFDVSKTNSVNKIGCLQGICSLSIMWIIYGHAYSLNSYYPHINVRDIIEYEKYLAATILFTSEFAYETFFLMSGFLTTKIIFNLMNRNKINFVYINLYRYLRLTSVLAGSILFTVAFTMYTSSGPIWFKQLEIVERCKNSWWVTLLYIQNYLNPNNMCFKHSWYLAVDTQLFLLAPIICIPLYKWKKFFWAVVALLSLAIVYIFSVYMMYNFSMKKMIPDIVMVSKMRKLIYTPTHTRAISWLFGVLFATKFQELGANKFIKKRFVILLGWLLAILITSSIVFGSHDSSLSDALTTKLESSFWGALSKIGWCISISWIIFACHYGFGGYINSFLSHEMWLPMARLSYCMYIIHPLVQYSFLFRQKTETYGTEYGLFIQYCAFLIITICYSAVAFLALESPCIGIIKSLAEQKMTSKQMNSKDMYNIT